MYSYFVDSSLAYGRKKERRDRDGWLRERRSKCLLFSRSFFFLKNVTKSLKSIQSSSSSQRRSFRHALKLDDRWTKEWTSRSILKPVSQKKKQLWAEKNSKTLTPLVVCRYSLTGSDLIPYYIMCRRIAFSSPYTYMCNQKNEITMFLMSK